MAHSSGHSVKKKNSARCWRKSPFKWCSMKRRHCSVRCLKRLARQDSESDPERARLARLAPVPVIDPIQPILIFAPVDLEEIYQSEQFGTAPFGHHGD